jgi:aryl-alcohol dehydrogenase-like predicted oxidoreductase
VEGGVLEAARELGTSLVCFSPIARGFFAGRVRSSDQLEAGDLRRTMPRFQSDNLARNLTVFEAFAGIAARAGCTPSQLALAWLLARGDDVVAIPGTTSLCHLEENFRAASINLSAEILEEIDALTRAGAIAGDRYPASVLAELDADGV